MPLVEQELLTLPELLCSPPVFSGARVTRSLVLCVCFVDRCLSFCTFSFAHCIVCSIVHISKSLPQVFGRRAWRYQRCNQNPYIEEQTIQWAKEKVQKDKQRSTKQTHKTKDRVTRAPLKTGGEHRSSVEEMFS
jgi:hypothetical protein